MSIGNRRFEGTLVYKLGQDPPKIRFKIGDRVRDINSPTMGTGTVKDISIGWNPELYYVLFDSFNRPLWLARHVLEPSPSSIEKEKVIFS